VKAFLLALLVSVIAYIIAAVGGIALIRTFSSNTHDRDLEATMTSFFVLGPFVAVLAFAITLGVLLTIRR
jgi:hypothetical protein